MFLTLFSSPELKAQVSFHRLLPIVFLSTRPSVCRFVSKAFLIFIYFSSTTEQISTKLGTKDQGWKGLKFVQMKARAFFQGEMIVKKQKYIQQFLQREMITKMQRRNLKIFFSWIKGPITNEFGTKHPWVKLTQIFPNRGHLIFQKQIMFFFPYLI